MSDTEKKITLCMKDADGEVYGRQEFTILNPESPIGCGRSSICYEAISQSGTRGVLKKFRPVLYSGVRKEDGRWSDEIGVLEGGDDYDRMLSHRYIRIHRQLKAFKSGKENRELSTFIPAFEIYFYSWDNEEGAEEKLDEIYLWEPEPPKITLEEVLERSEKGEIPELQDPEEKMRFLIEVLCSNLERTLALHLKGYGFPDNNPNNIAFRTLNGKVLTEHLVVIDTDAMAPFSEITSRVGTDGYMPQDDISTFTMSTDIMKYDLFAPGAILFRALTGEVYNEAYFTDIAGFVRNAPLMQELKSKWPGLADDLIRILKHSLCGRGGRYNCAEDFLEDLYKVRDYLQCDKPFSKAWNNVLYQDQYWCMDLIEIAPVTLAVEYSNLYKNVRKGDVGNTLFLMRDVFLLMLRIPVTALFNGIHRVQEKCMGIQDSLTDVLNQKKNRKIRTLYMRSFQILSDADWWFCAKNGSETNTDIFGCLGDPVETELYSETIRYLKELCETLTFLKPDENGVYKLTKMPDWIREKLSRGYMPLKEGICYPEIPSMLEMFRQAAEVSLDYYKNISLTDQSGQAIRGVDACAVGKDVWITFRNRTFGLSPFLSTRQKNVMYYAGYEAGKRKAYHLNYATGQIDTDKELSDYLRNHQVNTEQASMFTADKDIFAKTLEQKDINELDQRLFDDQKSVIGIPFLLEWLCDAVDENEKGYLLLTGEYGTGKSAFARSIDELDETRITDLKSEVSDKVTNFYKKTVVRVYHFRSDLRSRMGLFIDDIQRALLTFDPGDRENQFQGNVELSTKWSELYNCQKYSRGQVLAEALNETLDCYGELQEEELQKENLLLVLDGIDEITDFEEFMSYLPKPEALGEGVFILFTSRTRNELENRPEILTWMDDLSFIQEEAQDQGETLVQSKEFLRDDINDAVELYAGKILEEQQQSGVTDEQIKKLSEHFEYRFSDLAAYKRLCQMNSEFCLDANKEQYSGGTDLFDIFMNLLESKAPAAYVNRVRDLLNTLVWAGTPLTLRELAFLSGEQYVTYSLVGMLHDLQAFLRVDRSETGNRYVMAHAEWSEAVKNRYPEGRTQFSVRCEALLDEIFEYFNKENIASIFDEEHQGELWIVANILRIWEQDWPTIKNRCWEEFGIDRMEHLIKLILRNEKIWVMYYKDVRPLPNSGPVKQIIDTLMADYNHAISSFNQFNEYFFNQDFSHDQVGNYEVMEKEFEDFLGWIWMHHTGYSYTIDYDRECVRLGPQIEPDVMSDERIAALVYQWYSVEEAMPGKDWGGAAHRDSLRESMSNIQEVTLSYLSRTDDLEYALFVAKGFIRGVEDEIFSGHEDASEFGITYLMVLVNWPKDMMSGKEIDILSEQLEKFSEVFTVLNRLNAAENPLLMAHAYILIGEKDIYLHKIDQRGENTIKALESAYKILNALSDSVSDMYYLDLKYRAERGLADCTRKLDYWEKSIETATQILRQRHDAKTAYLLKDTLYNAGYAFRNQGEFDKALSLEEQAYQTCKKYKLECENVLNAIILIGSTCGFEDKAHYYESIPGYKNLGSDVYSQGAYITAIFEKAEELNKVSPDEINEIPECIMRRLKGEGGRYYMGTSEIEHLVHKNRYDPQRPIYTLVFENSMDAKTANLLFYLNRSYMQNEWLKQEEAVWNNASAAHVLKRLLWDIEEDLQRDDKTDDISITETECGEALWIIRNIPSAVAGSIPEKMIERIERLVEQNEDYGAFNFQRGEINEYHDGTVVLMSYLLDQCDDLRNICEKTVDDSCFLQEINQHLAKIEEIKLLHGDYYQKYTRQVDSFFA